MAATFHSAHEPMPASSEPLRDQIRGHDGLSSYHRGLLPAKIHLQDLPIALLTHIFGYLDYRSLSLARQVCKTFTSVSLDSKLDAIMFRQARKDGAAEALVAKCAAQAFQGSALNVVCSRNTTLEREIPIAHFPIELHPILREVEYKTHEDGTLIYQWPPRATKETSWYHEAAFSPGLDQVRIVTGRFPLPLPPLAATGPRGLTVGMVLDRLDALMTVNVDFGMYSHDPICDVRGCDVCWVMKAEADGSGLMLYLYWPDRRESNPTRPRAA
ncbi:hypothetical protein OC861_006863 [Tilletia horrida]|nr:hypothetical protein OC861_006863 [Tilletia horrida]